MKYFQNVQWEASFAVGKRRKSMSIVKKLFSAPVASMRCVLTGFLNYMALAPTGFLLCVLTGFLNHVAPVPTCSDWLFWLHDTRADWVSECLFALFVAWTELNLVTWIECCACQKLWPDWFFELKNFEWNFKLFCDSPFVDFERWSD